MLDVDRLRGLLDDRRERLGMSWRQVAETVGVSPATFTRMKQGSKPDVDGFLAMSAWLNRPVSDGGVSAAVALGDKIPVVGTVAIEDEPTGDGRMFAANAIVWETDPIPIIWDREDGDHTGATLGAARTLDRAEDGRITVVDAWLDGDSEDPDTQSAVTRAVELLNDGAVGVSIKWDQEESEIRVRSDALEEYDEDGELVEDGDGRVVVAKFRHDDAMQVITHARARHIAIVDTHAIVGARLAVAASGMLKLAAIDGFEGWFDNPQFGLPGDDDRLLYDPERDRWSCPPSVADDGRVFGHINPYGICLVGRPDRCIVPPEANNDTFMRFGCPAAGGRRTGVICVGAAHADVNIGVAAATAHYDKTGRAVADVRVGTDAYGVWYAGRVRPDADDDDVYALASSGVSGHWEPDGSGRMCLVGLPAVNVEGFPKGYLTAAQMAAGVTASAAAGRDDGCPTCLEDRVAQLEKVEAERLAATLDLDRRHADLLTAAIGVDVAHG